MTITQGVHRMKMQQAIENYILGRLNQEEIDKLWIQILKAPEWLGYLEIELFLRRFSKTKRG